MRLFSKVNAVIKTIAEYISMIALILLTLALFTGVMSRYVFSVSIPEIEVIRKFAIMWLVFMGAAIAVKENLHLEIDIFTEYLSETNVKIKSIVVHLLTLIAIIILILVGIAAFKAGVNRTELVSIRFLSSPPTLIYYYSAFLVGSIFMLYFHLVQIAEVFGKKQGEVKK